MYPTIFEKLFSNLAVWYEDIGLTRNRLVNPFFVVFKVLACEFNSAITAKAAIIRPVIMNKFLLAMTWRVNCYSITSYYKVLIISIYEAGTIDESLSFECRLVNIIPAKAINVKITLNQKC